MENKKTKLPEHVQQQIVKHFKQMIEQTIEARRVYDKEKLPEFWKRYRGEWSSKKNKSFPWDGSADFNVPFITWACASNQSRMLNATMASSQFVRVSSDNIQAQEAVEVIQSYLDYFFSKKINIERLLLEYYQRLNVEGTVILKPVYEKIYKNIKSYKKNENFDGYALDLKEEIIDGVKQLMPSGKLKVETKDTLVYEGPNLYVVPIEDFLFPVFADDLQESEWIAQRLYLSYRQLKIRARDNGWINVDKIKVTDYETVKGQEIIEKLETNEIDYNVESVKLFTPYEVWGFYDINDDGYEENCKFIIDIKQELLLDYEENINFLGLRPYSISQFHFIAGTLFGQGQPQRLSSMNDELDTTHNQIIDNATAINAFTFAYNPSQIPQKIDSLTIKPGTGVPVTSPTAITPLNFIRAPLNLYNHVMSLLDILKKLSTVSDASLGEESPNVERPTASGKAMLLQEFAVNFDIIIRNSNMGLKDSVEQILRLLYQHIPSEGMEFPKIKEGKYITENNIIKKVILKREHLEFINDLYITMTTSSINAVKGLEQNNIMALYDRLIQDPSLEINKLGLKEALIRAFDKNLLSKILRSPEEAEAIKQQTMLSMQMQQGMQGNPEQGAQGMPQQGQEENIPLGE